MPEDTIWMVLKGSYRWGRGWILPCFTPDIRLDLVYYLNIFRWGGSWGKEPLQLTLKPCCGEMLELSPVFTAHLFIHTHTYFSFQHWTVWTRSSYLSWGRLCTYQAVPPSFPNPTDVVMVLLLHRCAHLQRKSKKEIGFENECNML